MQNFSWFSLLSPFLVIAGWLVVYNNAKRLATRSETKSMLDDAIKIINEIESISVTYWLSGRKERSDHENHELIVLAKQSIFQNRLSLLKERKMILTDDVTNHLSLLIEYAILDCESADRMPADKRREITQNLLSSSTNLIKSLYTCYMNTYKPKH